MKNPWMKKNPLMSAWLSGANAIAGRARGQAIGIVSGQQAALATRTRRAWTKAWLDAVVPKRRR